MSNRPCSARSAEDPDHQLLRFVARANVERLRRLAQDQEGSADRATIEALLATEMGKLLRLDPGAQEAPGSAIRTFFCYTAQSGRSAPALSVVFARTEARACLLARKELLDTPDSVSVEILENGRTIAILER